MVNPLMDKEASMKKLKELLQRTSGDAIVGAGVRRPVKTTKKVVSAVFHPDPETRKAVRQLLKQDPAARRLVMMALAGPAAYTTAATAATAAAVNKYKKASVEGELQMDERTQEMAGRIMAHAFNDELEKLSMEKEAAMSNKAKMMLAGLGGLAAGTAGGMAAGYKMEQKRLSPQERQIVNRAMQHAYQQGNMAMYNRLKAMAAQRKAGKAK